MRQNKVKLYEKFMLKKGVRRWVLNLKLDFNKIKLPNGNTVAQQFKEEADRFVKILQEEIDNWYESYSPTMYDRTGAMKHSIKAAEMVDADISGMKFKIKINYSDDAFHPSMFGDGDTNVLLLMNSGYSVSSGWHKDIPYFGYRSGGHFLEKAVARFNESNYLGITVEANY